MHPNVNDYDSNDILQRRIHMSNHMTYENHYDVYISLGALIMGRK